MQTHGKLLKRKIKTMQRRTAMMRTIKSQETESLWHETHVEFK